MNKMKNICYTIMFFTLSIFFSPSLYAGLEDLVSAILSNEGDVSPERKKARAKMAASMITHLLNPIESNNVITTKCQRPTLTRSQSAPTEVDSFSFEGPVPEPQCTRSNAGPKHHPFFEDTRAKVQQPENWHHSVHGAVFWEYPGGKKVWKGSGTLIGPKLVLTCAHVLWPADHDITAYKTLERDRSLTFIPAMRADDKRTVNKFYIPEEYKRSVPEILGEYVDEDYALLVLNEDITQYTGYFGLSILPEDQLRNKTVHVTGYPQDKQVNGQIYMYEMEGKPYEVNESFFWSNIRSIGGLSGSGVWYQEGDNYYVAGVHARGSYDEARKIGAAGAVPITRARYEQIQQWIYDSFNELNLSGLHELNLSGLYRERETNFGSFLNELKAKFRGENGLGNFIPQALVQFSFSSLKILNLSNNTLDYEGALLLKEAKLPQLEELDLSNNQIGQHIIINHIDLPKGQELLKNYPLLFTPTNFLAEKLRSVEKLFPRTIYPGSKWEEIRSGILFPFSSRSVEVFVNYGKRFADDVNELRGMEISSNSRIQQYLDGRMLFSTSTGINALGEASWWPKLKKLNLKKNYIDNAGMISLALSWPPGLEIMDLGENEIGDEGVKKLLDTIKTKQINWKLKKLIFAGNHFITEQGKNALMEMNYHFNIEVEFKEDGNQSLENSLPGNKNFTLEGNMNAELPAVTSTSSTSPPMLEQLNNAQQSQKHKRDFSSELLQKKQKIQKFEKSDHEIDFNSL